MTGPGGFRLPVLHGMRVAVWPDPRRYYRLPADVSVTEEFRSEFDAWAEQFFPPDPDSNPLRDGEFREIGGVLYVNPRTLNMLRAMGPG